MNRFSRQWPGLAWFISPGRYWAPAWDLAWSSAVPKLGFPTGRKYEIRFFHRMKQARDKNSIKDLNLFARHIRHFLVCLVMTMLSPCRTCQCHIDQIDSHNAANRKVLSNKKAAIGYGILDISTSWWCGNSFLLCQTRRDCYSDLHLATYVQVTYELYLE